jgi:hypothetical protein
MVPKQAYRRTFTDKESGAEMTVFSYQLNRSYMDCLYKEWVKDRSCPEFAVQKKKLYGENVL